MTHTVIRRGEHRCHILYRQPEGGEVLRCDECGTYWLGHRPPNPNFWGWTRLGWFGRRIRGIR